MPVMAQNVQHPITFLRYATAGESLVDQTSKKCHLVEKNKGEGMVVKMVMTVARQKWNLADRIGLDGDKSTLQRRRVMNAHPRARISPTQLPPHHHHQVFKTVKNRKGFILAFQHIEACSLLEDESTLWQRLLERIQEKLPALQFALAFASLLGRLESTVSGQQVKKLTGVRVMAPVSRAPLILLLACSRSVALRHDDITERISAPSKCRKD
jgi:hypothetical protein